MKTALRVLLSAGLIAGFAWSAQAQTKLSIATVNKSGRSHAEADR